MFLMYVLKIYFIYIINGIIICVVRESDNIWKYAEMKHDLEPL